MRVMFAAVLLAQLLCVSTESCMERDVELAFQQDPGDGFVKLLQLNSREAADHADQAKKAMVTANESTSLRNFKYYAYRNCYAGHGGYVHYGDGYQGIYPHYESCANICTHTSWCYCFVWMYSQRKCWIRDKCDIRYCEAGVRGESTEFDTWTWTR